MNNGNLASNEYQQYIGHVWQRSLEQLDENHSSAKQQNHTLNSDLLPQQNQLESLD
jgi:hypothetical protein